MGITFNSLDSLPYIPYNIISHIAQDPEAEGFWKLLKYNSYDALSKPNLSLQEKMGLVCKNQENQNEYSIFLTRLVENEQTIERTILKLYKADTRPISAQNAIVSMEFDILCGAKTTIVDFNGYPCSRLDVMEHLIVKSLNGAEVSGVGVLQFNDDLTNLCRATFGIGNNSSYIGTALIMGTLVTNLHDKGC